MKKILTLFLVLCLSCSLWGCHNQSQDDTPLYSTKKASDDFSDLFKLNDIKGSALAVVTIKSIEETEDVIEYYDVYDTLYTKITATVDRDFNDRIQDDDITIMILGTAENFPQREEMVEGRSYLLRLESWVHESGLIYLLSPLESTYLRIFNGEILVHESATDLNYQRALTPDEFAEKYKAYQKENPPVETALSEHNAEILKKVKAYDYQNEELAYKLSEDAIQARLTLAEELNS